MEREVQDNQQSKMTIADVADALGISKTTVSRAISGKGRIGDATRQKVLAFIKENDYRPSVVARGLAQSRTYNIGWVMPGDPAVAELPFFQRCMMGISETAAAKDYDVLIVMVFEHDISQLERAIQNRKVDGMILGRTMIQDSCMDLLRKSDILYVVVGSVEDEDVIQIDNDHVSACRELTSVLLMKGLKKLALLGGNSNYTVNQKRLQGFMEALQEQGEKADSGMLYMDLETRFAIERAVEDVLWRNSHCIVCMDDGICSVVLDKLQREGVAVPEDVRVASFYSSPALAGSQPPITALRYDPTELGRVACGKLLDCIEGNQVEKRTLLQYEVLLKASTK